jgi:hypothetical protein
MPMPSHRGTWAWVHPMTQLGRRALMLLAHRAEGVARPQGAVDIVNRASWKRQTARAPQDPNWYHIAIHLV